MGPTSVLRRRYVLLLKLNPATKLYWKLQLKDMKKELPVLTIFLLTLFVFVNLTTTLQAIEKDNTKRLQECELLLECPTGPANYFTG
jgi:hypothetical protein